MQTGIAKFGVGLLRVMAKAVLQKYQPRIVAITGSIGKTSTREAVAHVLRGSFLLRQSAKNYNTEWGVPATIVGVEPPGRKIFLWIKVFATFAGLMIRHQKYPQVLVLEFALDRPGDISYLMHLAHPEIGVLTGIGDLPPVHGEFFSSPDELIQEKGAVLTLLPKTGVGILNADDARSVQASHGVVCRLLQVGKGEDVDFQISDIHVAPEVSIYGKKVVHAGTTFQIRSGKKIFPVNLPKVVAPHLAPLMAESLAVGKSFGVKMSVMIQRLSNFRMPPGRMQLLPARNAAVLLDDTYNASPIAVTAAVEVLKTLRRSDAQTTRRVLVLGHMAELDPKVAAQTHRELARSAVSGVDFFVGVGRFAHEYEAGAREAGLTANQMEFFEQSNDAAEFLKNRLQTGDVVLIKGSQSARMEKVTKALMANPGLAEKLLVRQSAEWL